MIDIVSPYFIYCDVLQLPEHFLIKRRVLHHLQISKAKVSIAITESKNYSLNNLRWNIEKSFWEADGKCRMCFRHVSGAIHQKTNENTGPHSLALLIHFSYYFPAFSVWSLVFLTQRIAGLRKTARAWLMSQVRKWPLKGFHFNKSFMLRSQASVCERHPHGRAKGTLHTNNDEISRITACAICSQNVTGWKLFNYFVLETLAFLVQRRYL